MNLIHQSSYGILLTDKFGNPLPEKKVLFDMLILSLCKEQNLNFTSFKDIKNIYYPDWTTICPSEHRPQIVLGNNIYAWIDLLEIIPTNMKTYIENYQLVPEFHSLSGYSLDITNN